MVAAMLALVIVLGMMPLGVLADEAVEASESHYILYEENFCFYCSCFQFDFVFW